MRGKHNLNKNALQCHFAIAYSFMAIGRLGTHVPQREECERCEAPLTPINRQQDALLLPNGRKMHFLLKDVELQQDHKTRSVEATCSYTWLEHLIRLNCFLETDGTANKIQEL